MARPLLTALLCLAGWANARAEPVFLDARDPWSLHDRRLLNRRLFHQLGEPEHTHRVVRPTGAPVAGAADLSIGTQIPWPEGPQTAYHGYFVLDGFAAFRVSEAVEVNLNLVTLNRTASAGYRQATEFLPGLALHLEGEVARVGLTPVRGEFLTTDLQAVTLGHGLLLERTPLEGHAGRLRFGDALEVWEVFGGEAFWLGDDLQAGGVTALDGHLTLTWLSWLLEDDPRADYLSLALSVPGLPDRLRIAGEVAARVPLAGADWAGAALLRVDWLDPSPPGGGRWHLGYQLRAYQRGFGPHAVTLVQPRAALAMPTREDSYVTNPFEFYGPSRLYHQVAHTVMLEAVVPIRAGFEFTMELEWIAKYAYDPVAPVEMLAPRPDERLPGWHLDLWNKIGFQYRPWKALPHRGRLLLSDKQVDAGLIAVFPTGRRFVEVQLISLEMEIFL
ncbi:MAG: hypothetical protein KC613_18600 [Myxococcales bacterium]|nr:hypothetical protein [Myxococcales bacterium]MCB9525486.1 hypothetical protein [Myxococcales bacterium]